MNRKKIGLALGAGGARGLAHIGVLKVLIEAGIKFDYIAGSSMGSIIGALYLCGMPFDYMEGITAHLASIGWKDVTLRGLGFIKGKRVEEIFRLLTAEKKFSDLDTPFAVVATDLHKGEPFIIDEGYLYDGLRASAAIPGFFTPSTSYNGRCLVDGAVIERVPVQTVRDMGADFVIAVDVKFNHSEVQINNALDVVLQSIEILEREVAQCSLSNADVLIKPMLDGVGTIQFEKVSLCVKEGERAAREVLPMLQERLAQDANHD